MMSPEERAKQIRNLVTVEHVELTDTKAIVFGTYKAYDDDADETVIKAGKFFDDIEPYQMSDTDFKKWIEDRNERKRKEALIWNKVFLAEFERDRVICKRFDL